ncbi:hypothetical protein BVG19_g3062 [[Candida] boidinii]|nr:hypothetical protein BVG19_g3062 [[Candida] boidinii]OWB53027.1 hypothetical protein B5S27_g4613 [[Candida] boidinii]
MSEIESKQAAEAVEPQTKKQKLSPKDDSISSSDPKTTTAESTETKTEETPVETDATSKATDEEPKTASTEDPTKASVPVQQIPSMLTELSTHLENAVNDKKDDDSTKDTKESETKNDSEPTDENVAATAAAAAAAASAAAISTSRVPTATQPPGDLPEDQDSKDSAEDDDMYLKEDLPEGSSSAGPITKNGRGRKPAPGTEEWHKQRKLNHKEVERRRRLSINTGIQELQAVIPSNDTNKSQIIKRAVEYIRRLKENENTNIEKWTLEKLITDQAVNELANSNEKLKIELEKAYREIEHWKKTYNALKEEKK